MTTHALGAARQTHSARCRQRVIKALNLGNAHDRIARLTTENQHLRNRLSEALGEQAWKETGLGAPTDFQQLQRRITELEQQTVELHRQLADRGTELDAARAANRDLMARLNTTVPSRQEQPWPPR